MIESHELGKKAEALAGEYLQKNGYRILARN
jgi:Holliday junction resolvase-like predicted endonuclease